jgi:hypothetical protein
MLDQLIDAFDRQNYPEVARILAVLPPGNPWKMLYQGRLQEVTGKWEAAETTYRQLLQTDCGPKISTQARQGLQRLAALQPAQGQREIAKTAPAPHRTELGVLVLLPVPAAAKAQAAQQLARILQLDVYSARLLLPSRGWRLYRTGAVDELYTCGQQLQAAGIPVFWQSLAAVAQIPVLQIRYFEAIHPQIVVATEPSAGSASGTLTFALEEVTQRVEGRLPIFEEVVDRTPQGKLQRKSQTQDYAQICDLHLPGRGCILRCHDGGYQFHQGVAFTSTGPAQPALDQQTSWANWNALLAFLEQQFPRRPIWNQFQLFAETAIEHPDLLGQLPSHINLFRRAASPWDPAFHLYSGLLFLEHPLPSPI